jgi:alanine-glyoxylate transaminase/serine-glyoxylate transaminase/serine-pyruvate transaminase
MRVKRGRNFLQTPGPTPVPERVLQAMHRQAIDFSGPEFIDLARSCFQDLQPIFKTSGPVFLYTASGHGAWEAALANSLTPGQRVLVPETGNFSASWSQMAEALGIEVESLAGDWRHGIDPAAVGARLAEDRSHEIKAVLAVHTDTATGITSDVAALKPAMDAAGHPALLMVDVVASLATVDFRMDDWGVDVAVAAAQKGLMVPPGLGFTAASEKALKVGETAKMPRTYWDWRQRQSEEHYRWFCGTAPEHLIFALREALDMLAEEGLDAIFARHARLAEATRKAVAVWSEAGALDFNARVAGERANSVTTILAAEDIDAAAFRERCHEVFDVSLGGGLGRLNGRAFRIGHMGDINEPMLLGALGAVEACLQFSGIPHGRGGVLAAVDYLAATAAE